MAESESIVLPDGRTLSYTTFGTPVKPDQPTAFHFHGFPGAHIEGQPFAAAALKKGIAIIAITRPGYGASSYQPNRTLLDWPKDVLALADHLHIQRFAVLGVSGGGPYVLACMHSIPRERLLGGVIVSGMYPIKLGTQGMKFMSRVIFTLGYYSTLLTTWMFELAIGRQARDQTHPEKFAQTFAKGLTSWPLEDQAAMQADDGLIMKVLVQSTRDAFRVDARGAAWEAWLFGSEWGFELEEVRVEEGRLVWWHGRRDENVPVEMAESGGDGWGGGAGV